MRRADESMGSGFAQHGKLREILRPAKRTAALAALSALLWSLPGCQSITGSPSLSQIRIVDASPNSPGMDIYEGPNVIAYNLGFGTITSYVPVVPGVYSMLADEASTRTQLVAATARIGASQQYTLLISNVAASLQAQVLTDQSSAAPTGEVSFRFIDEAVQIGSVDVYLVPSGSKLADVNPFLTNVAFSTVNGYLNLPVGNYAVYILAAGTTTVLYTGNDVKYSAGSARTFIVLDQQVLNKPAANVITAVDYDSPTVVPTA